MEIEPTLGGMPTSLQNKQLHEMGADVESDLLDPG